jgi:hypothetical protein
MNSGEPLDDMDGFVQDYQKICKLLSRIGVNVKNPPTSEIQGYQTILDETENEYITDPPTYLVQNNTTAYIISDLENAKNGYVTFSDKEKGILSFAFARFDEAVQNYLKKQPQGSKQQQWNPKGPAGQRPNGKNRPQGQQQRRPQ